MAEEPVDTGPRICDEGWARMYELSSKAFDHTAVITVEVPKEWAMEARSMKRTPRAS